MELIKKHWRLVIIPILVIIFFGWLTNFIAVDDPLKKADVIIAISGGDTESRTKHAIDLYQEG